MIALFIGRFQPFHSGHLDAIKQISEEKIIIGIGSSQYSGTSDNPYSFEERKEMIEKALGTPPHQLASPSWCGGKYKIIAIPDIHDAKNWVAHVKKIVGRFDMVYTGNELVKKLFKKSGHKVIQLKINIPISGTELRKKMKI